MVMGVAVTVAGALGAGVLMSRSGQRVEALVLTRDVAVGQPVSVMDLRVEPVLAGSTVPVVERSDAGSVIGRVAAVPLRAGHLLAPDDVGSAAWPPPGQVLLAVAVAAGSYPPELAAGMHVLVVAGPSDTAGPVPSAGAAASTNAGTGAVPDGLSGAPEAVVAGVQNNPTGAGGTVVSLLLGPTEAGQATSIPAARLRLVVVPAPAAAPAASTASAGGGGAAATPGGGG